MHSRQEIFGALNNLKFVYAFVGDLDWVALPQEFDVIGSFKDNFRSVVLVLQLSNPGTVIWIVRNCPKNQILSENISWASIYPLQVIEVPFYVKNSYLLIFIKLVHFLAISPCELQENLTFDDQYYLFWPILLKFMVVHIR